MKRMILGPGRMRELLVVGAASIAVLGAAAGVTAVVSPPPVEAGKCAPSSGVPVAEFDLLDGPSIRDRIPAFPNARELLPGGALSVGPLHVVAWRDREAVVENAQPLPTVWSNVVCIETPTAEATYFVDVNFDGVVAD
jgi:hypothetical protein